MQDAGWICEIGGVFGGFQEGATTRIAATGELVHAISSRKYKWIRLRPPAIDPVLVRGMRGEPLPVPVSPEIDEWRKNLHAINHFLLDHSICIWLQDHRLETVSTSTRKLDETNSFEKTLNFRNVVLRRIFGRAALDKGGRFYGGWWQNIPSEFRRHIRICGLTTTECDYSGMALRLLYAREGKALGEFDPYDIGIDDDSAQTRRKIIKRYVNASLNDERGVFQLSKKDYEILGLTRRELKDRVMARHQPVAHHFGTGVGMDLQFEDSCIAENVMLRMMNHHNVVALPVHDSFLVRSDYIDALQEEMDLAFRMRTGFKGKMKLEVPATDPDLRIVAVDGITHSFGDVNEFIRSYSIAYTYTQTNPLSHTYA